MGAAGLGPVSLEELACPPWKQGYTVQELQGAWTSSDAPEILVSLIEI